MMRKDIHVLFDMVERILAIQEGHEKEHSAMSAAACLLLPTADVSTTDQPNREPRSAGIETTIILTCSL